MIRNAKFLKPILIFLFSLAISFHATAQVGRFGIYAGANTSSVASEDSEGVSTKGSVTGYQAGGHINIRLNKFIIQPGLSYISKGGHLKYVNTNPAQPSDYVVKFYPKYLEVPLTMLYVIKTGKKSLSFGGGPYVSYAVHGKLKGNGILFGKAYSNFVNSIDFAEDSSGFLSPLDYGLNGKVNLPLANQLGLNLTYSHGISNISPGNKPGSGFATDVNNRTWGVSAVYSFK